MRLLVFGAALALCGVAYGEDVAKEIQRYRQMVAEGSPAELFELEGEALWKKPQGPKNLSLERCDLGKGPGVVKGAYAELPRYFADADRVMDLESRLVWCRVGLQGMSEADAMDVEFGSMSRVAAESLAGAQRFADGAGRHGTTA